MSHFRPKEVLHRAQQSEKNGEARQAANDYALLASYLRKKSKFSDAQKMIAKAIHLVPDSGRLYLEQSLCQWGLGESVQAETSVERCVQLGIEKQQLSTYLSHLNKDFPTHTRLKKKFFETWLALDRTQSVPFVELAELLIGEEKYPEAKNLLLSALKIDSAYSKALHWLGVVVEKAGQGLDIEYVERFKQQKISVHQLLILLGDKEAEPTPEVQGSESKVQRNSEGVDLKDLGELVADLEKELELEVEEKFENVEPLIQEFLRKSNVVIGSDLKARLDLAYAFFEMGRYREAKLELNEIEGEHVLYGQAQYLLGNILLKESSELAALGAFQTALRTAVKGTYFWKETNYQLAKLHLRLGDAIHAQKYLEEIEKTDPDYRELKALKKSVAIKIVE